MAVATRCDSSRAPLPPAVLLRSRGGIYHGERCGVKNQTTFNGDDFPTTPRPSLRRTAVASPPWPRLPPSPRQLEIQPLSLPARPTPPRHAYPRRQRSNQNSLPTKHSVKPGSFLPERNPAAKLLTMFLQPYVPPSSPDMRPDADPSRRNDKRRIGPLKKHFGIAK